jgi:tRNA (cytidine/uridine-2'-O-)-methyltransferase
MIPDAKARCLNLSNAVAVVAYEAFRQQPDFGGLSLTPTFHSGKLNSQYEL